MVVHLSDALRGFLDERHLATLVTLRADGSPHAVPVGFTWRVDSGAVLLRVITVDDSVKVRNARRGGRASITQLDGARWATFEGEVRVLDDDASVAGAEAAYATRYRPPKDRSDRVVIELVVDHLMCSS
ncbi:MAG: TIGR03618 family F420-dependent PPOX class oxidoreductase, partial [Ilumatobacteraceae bacterium]